MSTGVAELISGVLGRKGAVDGRALDLAAASRARSLNTE